MIKITIDDNYNLSQDSIHLLDATALAALPELTPTTIKNTSWSFNPIDHTVYGLLDNSISFIGNTNPINPANNNERYLTSLSISTNNKQHQQQLHFTITPLSETTIYQKLDEIKPPEEPTKPHTHSQLSACSSLIQEIYSNNPDYDINPDAIPKVFFSKLDLDYYLASLSTTLEESILLWMESTGILSVNLDSNDINMPLLLRKAFKRAFMFGPARNQVMLELLDGTSKPFSSVTPSFQLEIASEILSILPD